LLVNIKTEYLGDETDPDCLNHALRALDALGADKIGEWGAVAGSQDITRITFQVGPASEGDAVELTIETYMGVQLSGPRRWVDAIAREALRPEGTPGLRAPVFCLIGLRPAMAVATPEGGLDILALDWKTCRFERDMNLLQAVLSPRDEDVTFLDSREFRHQVEKLRKQSEG